MSDGLNQAAQHYENMTVTVGSVLLILARTVEADVGASKGTIERCSKEIPEWICF